MKSWMKLILSALAVVCCSFATHAEVVDVDGARAIATDFMCLTMRKMVVG